MSGWQPQQYDPSRKAPDPWAASQPQQMRYDPAPRQPEYRPAVQQPAQPPQPYARAGRQAVMTAAGSFWYVLGCIPMGAMYFAKVPAKKALQDAGMAQMTAAEQFWYVLMCIAFGGGYFAKLPVAKALSEMQHH